MLVHKKLCVYKTVTVGTNLHRLIYNVLMTFPIYFAISWLYEISEEDMLNTTSLGTLTEHQQVG